MLFLQAKNICPQGILSPGCASMQEENYFSQTCNCKAVQLMNLVSKSECKCFNGITVTCTLFMPNNLPLNLQAASSYDR